jgi:hypothetical protein
VTRFFSDAGVAQVIDFMPVKGTMKHWRNGIIRVVEGIRGDLEITMQCYPAFDYARKMHRTRFVRVDESAEPMILFQSPTLTLSLMTTVDTGCNSIKICQKESGVESTFVIKECQRLAFEICECETATHISLHETHSSFDPGAPSCAAFDPLAPLPVVEALKIFHSHMRSQCLLEIFKNNIHYWRTWVEQCTYRGLWQEKVQRSALALKLLTFEKTGAILAALTFGLPEEVGGERNWDYRYTWIRGATLPFCYF